jgi:hypothetical protein
VAKSKKAKIVLSDEEQKLVDQLRTKRTQMEKLRTEMDALEAKIRPLAARRVGAGKMKKAGLTEEEINSLTEKGKK